MQRLCSGLVLALVATPAGAQPERQAVEFRWDAPADCPPEAEVVAELERLLGGPLAQREGPRLTAIARVRREADGFDLRLWTVSDDGTLQRSIVHPQCDALAKAGALIAAMAIDPSVLERMAEGTEAAEVAAEAKTVADPEPVPEPTPEPAPKVEPPPEPEKEPIVKPEPKRRTVRGALRIAAGVSYGDLPGAGALLRVTPALLWPRARLELEASYGPVRKARFDDDPQRGADLQLATAGLRGCAVLRARKLEFPLCAGVELGAIYGRGVGYAVSREGRLLLASLSAAPAIFYVPHPRVAVGALVEGAVHVARPRFTVEGAGEVYRAAPASVRALAAIELRFP